MYGRPSHRFKAVKENRAGSKCWWVMDRSPDKSHTDGDLATKELKELFTYSRGYRRCMGCQEPSQWFDRDHKANGTLTEECLRSISFGPLPSSPLSGIDVRMPLPFTRTLAIWPSSTCMSCTCCTIDNKANLERYHPHPHLHHHQEDDHICKRKNCIQNCF